MSSTSRGTERSKFDYYVTPIPAIEHFLKAFKGDVVLPKPMTVLDPCAGGDANNPASYPTALLNVFGPDWVEMGTIDIRPEARALWAMNYLTTTSEQIRHICGGETPDTIISNPPFDLALEFISKSLREVKSGGCVVMLCRLNFFGSDKRFEFWQNHMPTWTYVHSERMSFTSDGRTDSIEYAHLVWVNLPESPRFTKLRVI